MKLFSLKQTFIPFVYFLLIFLFLKSCCLKQEKVAIHIIIPTNVDKIALLHTNCG